jgi:hypothetical protein
MFELVDGGGHMECRTFGVDDMIFKKCDDKRFCGDHKARIDRVGYDALGTEISRKTVY